MLHQPNQEYYAQGLGPRRNSKAGKKLSFVSDNQRSEAKYTTADLTCYDNENLDEFS